MHYHQSLSFHTVLKLCQRIYCTYALPYVKLSFYIVLDIVKLNCPHTPSLYTFSTHCYCTLHVDRYCYVHTVTRKKNHVILSLDTVIHALSLDNVIDILYQTLTVQTLSFESVLTHSVAYTYAKSDPKVCCVVLSQSVTYTRRASVIMGIFLEKSI